MDIPINGEGNLTRDPELRYTATGKAVVTVTVAVTHRRKNRESGQREDIGTTFLRGDVWGDQAEHITESLSRGTRVVFYGQQYTETYPDRETGEERQAQKVAFDWVAPSLRFATAKVTKAARDGGQGPATGPAEDPWSGEAATLTPEEYAAHMQNLRTLGATPV